MKALSIVSSVVFLHVLAFVVLVNGCSTRASRARENYAKQQQQSELTSSAPTAGEQVVDLGAPSAGEQIEEIPSEPIPEEPKVVEEPPAPKKAPAGTSYVVKRGDSLWLIAKKHKVSINAICENNGIKKNAILREGMTLKIPASTAQASAQSKSTSTADGTVYVVKRGDALSIIARRNGTTVKAIKEANNLSSDNIRIGQKLVIPGKKSEKAAAKKEAPAPAPVKKEAAPIEPEAETIPEEAEDIAPVEPVEGEPSEPIE